MGWHSRSVVSSASFSPSLTRAARSSGTLESFEDGVAGLLPPGVPETGVVLGSIIAVGMMRDTNRRTEERPPSTYLNSNKRFEYS